MTHLTDDELRHWMAHGAAGDRERVIGHLAECETCRRALSAMAQEPVVLDTTAGVVSPAEVRDRGYAAYAPAPVPVAAWRAWLTPAYGLAAAVVVLAFGLLVMRPGAPLVDDGVRGSEILLLAPAGTVSGVAEFRWTSPVTAPRYRVTVRDAQGAVVFSGESTAERVSAGPDVVTRFAPARTYTWEVAAIDEAGEVIGRSKPATFSLTPR